MSRFILFNILAVVLISISGCGGERAVRDKPIIIKFSHVTSPTTPKGQGAERFRQLVEERLGDRVKVEVYPSGQLMNDDDSIEALAFGEIQMIATSLSKFDRLTNKFQVFDLPFLFPNLGAVEKFQQTEQGRSLLSSLSSDGIQGLAFWHNGMKQFGGPVAMYSAADADGLKFRIMESDVLQAQVLAMGGNPQKMAFGEVYQALQTGAVDAQENTWSNIYSSKFFEVQNVLTESNHGYLGYLVAVNKSFWEGLPGDIKPELEAIVDEVAQWVNSRATTINREAKDKIVVSGKAQIVNLNEQQLIVWRQVMQPVWKAFEDNIGAKLISAAQGATAE